MDQVLYRKYRPKAFAEVVEQQHVIRTLSNALKMGKIAHAYLFCGPRGVGKTTIARILAKAVNCKNAVNGDACNACENCKLINEQKTLDIIEIDAASNRGIDEIRNLQDRIKHPPSHLKYKVFIIDEVHMMTQGAFNALLKTLEEPPAHALFLFATTESHKVPATILSRCQRFDLKKVSLDQLVACLAAIAQKEGVQIDQDALQLVSLYADGCVRDAQSLLMQVFATAHVDGSVGLTQVKEVLAIPDFSHVASLIDALASHATQDAILLVNKLADDGIDLHTFARQVIDYLRKVLVAKINTSLKDRMSLALSDASRTQFESHVQQLPIEHVMKLLKLFVDASEKIKSAVLPQLPLELAITSLEVHEGVSGTGSAGGEKNAVPRTPTSATGMRAAAPQPVTQQPQVVVKKKKIIEQTTAVMTSEQESVTTEVEEISVSETTSPRADMQAIITIALPDVHQRWQEVIERARNYNHSVSAFLQVCWPMELNGNVLQLAFKFDFHKERIRDVRHRQVVERVLDEVFGQKLCIECLLKPDLVIQQSRDQVQNVEPIKHENAPDDKQLLDQVLEVFGGKVVE